MDIPNDQLVFASTAAWAERSPPPPPSPHPIPSNPLLSKTVSCLLQESILVICEFLLDKSEYMYSNRN